MSWCAPRRGTVDGSDVLGIAQGAIDRRRIDGDLAGACLPSLAAAPTHGDGDLELRAARGLGRRRAVEHRAGSISMVAARCLPAA
jgi:hypothetical protein